MLSHHHSNSYICVSSAVNSYVERCSLLWCCGHFTCILCGYSCCNSFLSACCTVSDMYSGCQLDQHTALLLSTTSLFSLYTLPLRLTLPVSCLYCVNRVSLLWCLIVVVRLFDFHMIPCFIVHGPWHVK